MKSPLTFPVRYLLVLFAPVGVVALLVGVLNVTTLKELERTQQHALEASARSFSAIKRLSAINAELVTLQQVVHATLEQRALGMVDDQSLSGIRSDVRARLASIASDIARHESESSAEGIGHSLGDDFNDLSEMVLRTIDVLQSDAELARHAAYDMGRKYLHFSEHARDASTGLSAHAESTLLHSQGQVRAESARLAGNGLLLICALLILWLIVTALLARRIALLARTTQQIAQNVGDLDAFAEIEWLAARRGPFQHIAQAVMSYRRAVLQQRVSEIVLNERIKEISCLHEVTGICDDLSLTTDQLIEQTIGRLPQGMRFPEFALARIETPAGSYGETADGERIERTAILAAGQQLLVRVSYPRKLPPHSLPSFLDEEGELLQSVASLIATTLDRRQLLASERKNHEILQAVVSEAPDAIELVDAETLEFIEVNRASCELLGYSHQERMAMQVPDIQHGVSPSDLAEMVPQTVEQGSLEFETRHRRKDGSLIDVLVRAKRIRLEDRDYILGVWRDITEQKRAYEAVRKMSLVVEQSPSIIVITDIDANIEYVNEAFVRATGFTRNEVVGYNPRMLKSGRTPASTYRNMWDTLTRGESWRGEFINRARDGKHVLEDALIVPLKDDSGAVTHYVAVKEDVTHRRQQENLIRKLSMAVEQSPEGIIITNLRGEIEYANAAYLANAGYAADEVLGRNPRIMKSGATPESTYNQMWARLSAGEPWRGELVNRRKDGSDYTVLANIAPIRQIDGTVTHFVGIQLDITTQKQMLEELDNYRLRLEKLVDERTGELQLAKEAAESANRSKGEFLANMSHEIRTPMNAIIGLTHLLRRETTDTRQLDQLRKIDGAAQHLLQLINDILDLSKIEAGRLQLESVQFSPSGIVSNTLELVHDRAKEKGLALTAVADELPPVVRGDGLRLGQILLNFLSNAVKFTDSGSVTVKASVLRRSARRIILRFEVTDTGIGLSAEQQERMFRAFEQADSSTTRKYGGTGLGLAICQRLATLMQGRIGVLSTPGQGSTFWVELPFAPCEETNQSGASPSLLQNSEIETVELERRLRELPAKRILLAEDNPINSEVALELLQTVGLQADLAPDGQIALDMARTTKYDLILMDMQMPVLDGLSATRQIRSLPGHASTPILAMTANAFAEDREACLAAGMNDHVAKPVNPKQLFSKLLEWLNRSGSDEAHPEGRT